MKKLVSVVAALVLCLAMTTTCFAASPVKITSDTPGVDVVNVKPQDIEKVDKATATKDSIQSVINSVASGKYTVSEAATVAVFALENVVDKDVTINVEAVKAGKTYVVVHWKDDGTVEVIDPKAVAEGKITFHVNSCSPFAIVEVTSTAVAQTPATSPKTSEAGAMAAVAVMLISAAGIVVLNRRKFA